MNVTILLQGLATLFWVAVVILLALSFVRAARGLKLGGMTTVILVLVALALVLTTISAGLVFVRPEERGVVISAIAPKGYRETPLQPGLRWIIPFFEEVERYSISRQTYTMSIAPSEGQIQGDDSISARTLDGQEIFVDASVIYAIDPIQVVKVHIDWQNRYQNELVRPLVRGVIRDAISQYQVDQVVSTNRVEMSQKINNGLNIKLSENGLILVDFVLRNITFSPEYAASVEQKQIAEQQAQQAKLTVEQRKQEAEQARQVARGAADAAVIRAQGEADARIIQAEAEAKALELLAAALKKNPDLLNYTYIQKLAPGIQVMLVPNDAPYLLPLPELTTPTTTP